MSEKVTFTVKQIRFIEWLAAAKADRRPKTQIDLAKEIGVNDKTLTRWKKLPGFRDAVTARARELLGDDLPQIYDALRKEAIAGSYKHIELSFKLTGEFVERHDINLNVQKGYVGFTPDEWND